MPPTRLLTSPAPWRGPAQGGHSGLQCGPPRWTLRWALPVVGLPPVLLHGQAVHVRWQVCILLQPVAPGGGHGGNAWSLEEKEEQSEEISALRGRGEPTRRPVKRPQCQGSRLVWGENPIGLNGVRAQGPLGLWVRPNHCQNTFDDT